VTDPREQELPAAGLLWVEDAETGEQLFVDTDDPLFRQRLAKNAEAQLGGAVAGDRPRRR